MITVKINVYEVWVRFWLASNQWKCALITTFLWKLLCCITNVFSSFFVFFFFVIKATSRINLERWKVRVKLTEPADLKGKCEGEVFRKTLFANIVWFVSCKGRRKLKKNNLSLKTSVQWGGLENGDLFVFVQGFGGRLGPPAYYTREIWKQSNLWWKKKMGCTLEGMKINMLHY